MDYDEEVNLFRGLHEDFSLKFDNTILYGDNSVQYITNYAVIMHYITNTIFNNNEYFWREKCFM